MSDPPREFNLTLRDEGQPEDQIRRLRSALKILLRGFQFRNTRLVPAISEAARSCVPASVPSLVQSSRPCTPSSARK